MCYASLTLMLKKCILFMILEHAYSILPDGNGQTMVDNFVKHIISMNRESSGQRSATEIDTTPV